MRDKWKKMGKMLDLEQESNKLIMEEIKELKIKRKFWVS